jgi:hypothetical protein
MWMRGQVAVLASCAGLLGACGGGGEADENAAMGGGQAPPEQSSEASGPQAPNPEQAEAIGQTVRDFAALMDVGRNSLDVPVERRQEACKLLTPEVQAAWVQLSDGEAGDCPTAIDPLGADGLAEYPLLVDEDGTDILDSGNDAYREALDDVDINIVLEGPSTALAILHGTAKAFELTSADGRWLISRPAMVPVAEETVPLVAYGNAMRQCVMENAEAVGFPGQFTRDRRWWGQLRSRRFLWRRNNRCKPVCIFRERAGRVSGVSRILLQREPVVFRRGCHPIGR